MRSLGGELRGGPAAFRCNPRKREISFPNRLAMVVIKRAYDVQVPADGTRVLVDRLWPRGVTKREARVEKWMRELGPSAELRQFFGHDPARWKEFRKRYIFELRRPEAQALISELLKIARSGKLTLVYGARDEEHNQAVVIKELLDKKLHRK